MRLVAPIAPIAVAVPARAATSVLLGGLPADRAGFYATIGLTPDGLETFETLPMPHDTSVASFAQNGVTYTALTSSTTGRR